MKKTALFSLISLLTACTYASPIKTLWNKTEDVSTPESVYFDPGTQTLFVSNIAGAGDAKDSIGWIQKLSSEGKVLNAKWVTGLNAPKGMRAYKSILWVSDIDSLVSIDIKTGKVLKKIEEPKAKFLNDVAIDEKGNVFVSDTMGRAIYQLKNNKLEIFIKGDETEAPNGLLVKDDKLIVAAWGLGPADWSTKIPGRLYSIDLKTKAKTLITKEPLGNLDGLEIRSNGNYLVSNWVSGEIFEITPDGKEIKTLIEPGEQGFADVGYIPSNDSLIVPRMVSNQVTAYDLNGL